jgi:cell wall-associated NlpC family hydrolase
MNKRILIPSIQRGRRASRALIRVLLLAALVGGASMAAAPAAAAAASGHALHLYLPARAGYGWAANDAALARQIEARIQQARAQAVITAARSQLGVPYRYTHAEPGVGFDCSGLAMWAWGRAGVSLPHSSAEQYAVLPHVARKDLRPGDLLFFYSPIHHVAIYLGHGRMIHAPHTGEHVRIQAVYWRYFVGAARP